MLCSFCIIAQFFLAQHFRALYDSGTLIRIQFGPQTAEKLAPPFWARLDVANCSSLRPHNPLSPHSPISPNSPLILLSNIAYSHGVLTI